MEEKNVITPENSIDNGVIVNEEIKIIECLDADKNKKKSSKLPLITDGLLKNNPVFRLVLGTCPTLAVTTMAINGIGMGLATTFVLICSNLLIAALRKIIPDKVRIPAYILIIATFVTIVEMILKKYIPSLYGSLGLYIPLIVVNCIIFARAESFASCNSVIDSGLDGLGMGLGFTVSITVMGMIREFLGAGSFFGIKIPVLSDYAMSFFILPAGGFLTFGFMIAGIVAITAWIEKKKALKGGN